MSKRDSFKYEIRRLIQFKESEWQEICEDESVDIGELIKEVFDDIEKDKKRKSSFYCELVCQCPDEYQIGIRNLPNDEEIILAMVYGSNSKELVLKIFETIKKEIDLEDYD